MSPRFSSRRGRRCQRLIHILTGMMYTMKIHVHAILAILPLKKFEDVFLKLRMVVIFNNEKLTTEKRFLYIPSTSIFHGQQHKYS